MAVTIKIDEAQPAIWPLIDGTAQSVAWARIEGWINTRWPSRSVTFFVQDAGTWEPPLTPFSANSYERWKAGFWEVFTPQISPFGAVLGGAEEYRIAGTVGDDTHPPEIVVEAVRRLARYQADTMPDSAGASNLKVDVSNVGIEVQRSPSWKAKALQNSGAADLLRRYRRRV